MPYKIGKFPPPKFQMDSSGIDLLRKIFPGDVHYASAGRWALANILLSIKAGGRVLIPEYICSTVIQGIKKAGWTWKTYGIDEIDLNPSPDDAREALGKDHFDAILVPSLYGNPADMDKFLDLKKEFGVFLIDDAAQSFGSKVGEQFIGTFGDAGFFSFAPGKSTVAHAGAFYWSRLPVKTCGSRFRFFVFDDLIKRTMFLDYFLNRLHWGAFKILGPVKRMIGVTRDLLMSRLDWSDLPLLKFEKPWLGGAIEYALSTQTGTQDVWREASQVLFNSKKVRIVKSLRGNSRLIKIVLVCTDAEVADRLVTTLRKNGFYADYGYKNSAIGARVVELPLIPDLHPVMEMMALVKEIAQ